MKVTKTSPFSGEEHTIEVHVTEDTMEKFRKGRITISEAFGHLDEPDRRFLVDGITPDEWQEMFEEADYMRYDTHATRAFWVCYAIILVAVVFFCCILWGR